MDVSDADNTVEIFSFFSAMVNSDQQLKVWIKNGVIKQLNYYAMTVIAAS